MNRNNWELRHDAVVTIGFPNQIDVLLSLDKILFTNETLKHKSCIQHINYIIKRLARNS